MSSERPDPDARDSFFPDGEDDTPGEDARARRKLERVVREVIRRTVEKGVEAGIGTISRTDEAIRGVVGDVKLPREVVAYVFSAVDETKNSLVRGVAREVREFLEATDIAHELQRALTTLSFEIKTEIRFILFLMRPVKGFARASGRRPSRGGSASGAATMTTTGTTSNRPLGTVYLVGAGPGDPPSSPT
jgi:hypothetical protein